MPRHAAVVTALMACLLAMGLLGLSACGPDAAEQRAQQAAQREAEATRQLADYDSARSAAAWARAAALGRDLQDRFADSAAARAAARSLDDVRTRAQQADEAERLAGLWSYSTVPAGRGEQRAAMITAQSAVATGAGAGMLQLVFRDHPVWGRNAYLVLDRGGFACTARCRVQVAVDGAAARTLTAYKPTSHEAIALFIEDSAGLWRMARAAKTLVITFPTTAGPRSGTFETGGLRAAALPGWR